MFLNPPFSSLSVRIFAPFPQLREEFDRGIDVQLDEEHSIHDVAALLKEFLRDMPDPLLTKELYTPLINTTREHQTAVTLFFSYFLFFDCLLFWVCSIGARRATKCHSASDLLTSCLQQ